MSDSGLSVIKAVVGELKAAAGLIALVSDRVFTDIPQQEVFPYILVEIRSDVFSAKDFSDMQHVVRVHIYGRKPSLYETLAIRKLVFAALDRQEGSITLDSGNLVMIQYAGLADTIKEPDGITWHSVIEFKVTVN